MYQVKQGAWGDLRIYQEGTIKIGEVLMPVDGETVVRCLKLLRWLMA
jgi:hypothetical protein